MRTKFPELVEKGRCTDTEGYVAFATKPGDRFGAFKVRCPLSSTWLKIIVSDGQDWQEMGMSGPAWEHVSVSNIQRCPTWEEMAWVKDLFFGEEETVIEFHPPKSQYVNRHPNCLHLWKPVGIELPRPPLECV